MECTIFNCIVRQITIQFLAFWTFVKLSSKPPSNFYTINFIVKVIFSSIQKMWTLTSFNSNITCKIHCMNMFSINVLLLYTCYPFVYPIFPQGKVVSPSFTLKSTLALERCTKLNSYPDEYEVMKIVESSQIN